MVSALTTFVRWGPMVRRRQDRTFYPLYPTWSIVVIVGVVVVVGFVLVVGFVVVVGVSTSC